MELITREYDSGLVITFPEQLQLEGDRSFEFKGCIRELIHGRASRVIVDLSNVGFIDSSGLGALISALKVLRANGGDLVLCSMSSQVRTVFEITRLFRVFEVFEGPEPAMEIQIDRLAGAAITGGE